VVCYKECSDFHQVAVYVANILTFSIGAVLPTSQGSWEHNYCSWMQFTIKCPQFEDEEEVYEDLCYVTFSSSPPEVQGLTTCLSCWTLFLHVYILFYIVLICLHHQFLELCMEICCFYFVCWKLRIMIFLFSNCKESLATGSLLLFLLAHVSLLSVQVLVPCKLIATLLAT
jgi:hypothetical protein